MEDVILVKMANENEQFKERFDYYSNANEGLARVIKSGSIPFNVRELTKQILINELPENSPEQIANKQIALHNIENTRDQKVFVNTLSYWTGVIKNNVNKFSQDNLEGILNNTDKGYVDFALNLVKPKDTYSGTNAETYTSISKLKNKVDSMKTEKPENVEKLILDKLKSEYNVNDEKEKRALEYLTGLAKLDKGFPMAKYAHMVHAVETDYHSLLEPNKVGYLAANLKGEDFVGFYDASLQAMEKAQIQAQRKAERDAERVQQQRQRQPVYFDEAA